MPFTALALKPGIDVEQTPLLNSAGYSESSGIRFFQGMPQKAGGWTALNTTALTGMCRGLHAWSDLNGTPWIAAGTNSALQVYNGGVIYDITPIIKTSNPALDITTTSGSKVITVKDAAHAALAGDYMIFVVPVSVGGLILYGTYEIKTIVDADYYTIESAVPALYTYPGGTPSNPISYMDATADLIYLADYTTLPLTDANVAASASNPLAYYDYANSLIYLPEYTTYPLTDGNITATDGNPLRYIDTDAGLIYAPSYTMIPLSQTLTVPVFTTTSGESTVSVFLPSHGLQAGENWSVDVSTDVGGITLSGSYAVQSVTNISNFVIQASGTASSDATVSENGGNARFYYLMHSGPVSSYYSSGSGYGSGDYGSGPYGEISNVLTLTRARQWFLSHIGQDLIGNYNGSPLYVWDPSTGPSVRALELNTTNFPGATSPPTSVNMSFVTDYEQMIVCMGCDDVAGNYDPNLIRWSDLADFTQWYPTTTNQAGSRRINSGSRIVGGISAPNFIVFWTDVDMWLMSYIGGSSAEFVWGFTKIAEGVDLIAPRAAGILQSKVYWPSYNGFYVFDGGSVQEIVCPVWDKFWANLDKTQIDKVNVQVNATFNEISWGFASLTGSGEVDQRITLSLNGNSVTWTYDEDANWARTAWINNNVYGPPIGTDTDGILQQHETASDANGEALTAYVRSGWFSAQEGSLYTLMERLSADMVVRGGDLTVQVTVYAQDYPSGPVRTYGPYDWVYGSGPPFSIVRARGRFFSIKIGSSSLGVFWRLGRLRYVVQPSGKR